MKWASYTVPIVYKIVVPDRTNRVWSRSEARSFCARDFPCETILVKLLVGNISH